MGFRFRSSSAQSRDTDRNLDWHDIPDAVLGDAQPWNDGRGSHYFAVTKGSTGSDMPSDGLEAFGAGGKSKPGGTTSTGTGSTGGSGGTGGTGGTTDSGAGNSSSWVP